LTDYKDVETNMSRTKHQHGQREMN